MNPLSILSSRLLRPHGCTTWVSLRVVVMSVCLMPLGMVHAQNAAETEFAQSTVQNTVYVCEQQGVTVLRNTPPLAPTMSTIERAPCMRKTITTKTLQPQQLRRLTRSTIPSPMWNDPQRTAQTLVIDARVSPNVQWQRDLGRKRILLAELGSAEQRLQVLKAEYRDGQPERLGNEKNYQKYLDRTAELQQNIRLTEASIAALRREINAIGGMP
mgnify:CR=1 FL=1